MFVKMLEKTETYLKKALNCKTLVFSTILNPFYRLAIFEAHSPNKAEGAKRRIVELFKERKNQMAEKVLQDKEHEKKEKKKRKKTATQAAGKEKDNDKTGSWFSGPSHNPGKDETDIYLGGMDCIIHGDEKE
jgi:hypothetical protein